MTTPIAIIGIGCRLPGGADTPERFWDLLCDGVDAITEIPPDRFDLDELFDPDPAAPGKTYTRWGGFVDDIDRFDADFFGIAPREAKRMDPQHRLLLEVVWEALEDGGQVPERLAGTDTGVFVGIATHDYGDLHLAPGRRQQVDAHVNIGNALCAAPNRVSYQLDLHGPSMAIETACSSSLTALHLACRSLEAGESGMAIVGGVNALLTPELTIGFCKATMMSPDGRCHAFDARANGYVRGEGAGAVILKPLPRALADRDPVYAVIRGTAVNEDGRTSGISLPNPDAHEALLREALRRADVAPSALQYVEAHGTGTVVGDPAEAGALGRVLGRGRPRGEELVLGSVKTNIGHLEAGAGIAGLLKGALMLRHRRIPPSLHHRDPNPAIPFDELGLRVATELEDWPAADGPAMAAVNSFGFGGSNAHVILAELGERPIPPQEDLGDPEEAQVLVLSARTAAGLADAVQRHRLHLEQTGAASLRDRCATAAVRRSHHEHRLAVVGGTSEELIADLDRYLEGEHPARLTTGRCSSAHRPKLAFVFAGMGPQWWGMGQQLLAAEPTFRAALEQHDRLLAPLTGWSLLEEIRAGEDASRIDDTRVAQVVNCAVQLGLAALWRSWGVVPDAVVGHSAGELAAAHTAGALRLTDTLVTAYHRGRLLHRAAGTGTMLAAGISGEEAEALAAASGGRVALAAVNSATSVTLSGDGGALRDIAAVLERDERFCRLLPVEVPYHGPQMDALHDDLLEALGDLRPSASAIPLVTGVTGTWVGEALLDRTHWWRTIRQPVRFAAALETLVADGVELFVEISPHPALAHYVAECLAGHDGHDGTGAVLPSLRRGEDERATMLRTLGELHVRGRDVDWSGLYPGGACVRLPTYPWQRERHWLPPVDPAAARSSGVDTGHPLLGRRLPTAHPVWEADLADPRSDYLDAHVVEDVAAFPGAAYVDMALAAAQQIHGGAAVALEGVEFRKLLFLERPRSRRLQVLSHPGGDVDALEILSAPADDATAWTLHATAAIRPPPAPTPATVDLDELRARCTEAVPADHHYAALQAYGFAYGSPFRGLEATWTGDGEALARVGFPADVDLPVGAHAVHPALLDAGLQLLVAAAGMPAAADVEATRPLFPVAIRRVVHHRPPGERFWAHVRVREADGAGLEGDVTLVGDDGVVALACEGLRFRALDERAGRREDGVDTWLYELTWEEAPLATPAGRGRAALRSAHEVRATLEEHATDPEADPGVVTYHARIAPALDRIATGFAAAALDELGWDPARDGDTAAGDVAEALGVVPPHRRLLGALLEAVRASAGDAPPRDRAVLRAELEALAEEHPAFAAEVALLRRGGERLAEVLRGEVDAREVLLSGEALTLISRLYHDSPASRAYHEVLADAITEAVGEAAPASAAPGSAPVLLEVGAGTGAATAAILPRLPESAGYVFTDISPHFLRAAEERFGKRAGMRFATFDLEQDPSAQDVTPHSVDVVVAANVLHTTADLRATLGSVRRLLAPGGLLVVLELARSAIWYHVVFGLLDGWWRFRDAEVRTSGPLVDAAGWRALLEDCGFEPAAVPFTAADGRALQTVLLAHTPAAIPTAPDRPTTAGDARTWLLFADEGGVGERLAATLTDRGDDCRLVRRGLAYRWNPQGAVELPAGDTTAVERLLDDLTAAGESCDGIVHLWSLDIPPPDALDGAALLEAQSLGCGSVLALVQGLAAHTGPTAPVWLVTAGSQAVAGHDAAPQVAQAPLWGLGRVLMSEEVARCRLVDLGPSCSPEETEALADELRRTGPDDAGEAGEADEEIALRGGSRLVRRLQRLRLDDAARPTTTRSASPDAATFRLESDAAGTLERLQLREAATVEPGPGEVAIRVRASGLTFRDVLKGLGMLPEAALGSDPEPRALGVECSGTVVASGAGVEELAPGDDVVALGWAAHGSRVVTSADLTARKPADVTFAEAASLANAFVTADHALHEVARIRPGERVLVHAAAGAVGLAAIQVCQRAGAEVFATAGTPEKRAHLRGLGVVHVGDSRSLDFVDVVREGTDGEGVDVVLNSLSGELLRASLDLLRPYGRFVELGKRDIYDDAQVGLLPFQRSLTFTAVDLIQLALDRPEHGKRLLVQALQRIADGIHRPVPCTLFDLGEAEEAFRFTARAQHIGKVVLTVDEPTYDVASAAGAPVCSADGTYLVTGGLGGFGLALAGWLVEQGARTLVLLSRSGVPKDGDAALAALRGSPATVHVVQGDAADEADMARVLTRIRTDLPPLRGVLHAAMVLDDDAVVDLDEERFRAVLAPKVAGAWNLHRLTAEDPLDLFVLCSSIASVVGHPMQGSYAAANAFLDSLAAHRAVLGLPALTVGWGAVADVGYVARHPEVATYLDRGGFGGFTPAQALDTLGRLLRTDRPHVVAAIIDWATLLRAHPVLARSRRFLPFTTEVAEGDAAPSAEPGAGPLALLREAAPQDRRDVVERYLLERVARVLGGAADRVDPERPLPELGFDSLMAVELTTAIKTDLTVRLATVKVLQGGTCRGLAGTILDELERSGAVDGETDPEAGAGTATGVGADPDGEREAAPREAHPLAFEQARLWFLQRLEPENPAYHVPSAVRLTGPLDVAALRRALDAVVERHEILRATIHEADGVPFQTFEPPAPVDLPVVDLSPLPEPERAAELSRRMTASTRVPFDLATGPLLRASLYRLTETEHVVLLVVHHIACDAWSMRWVAGELAALYDAFTTGAPSPLPPPAFRYVDHVRRERERLDDDLVASQLAYWTDQLAGASGVLQLPPGPDHPPTEGHRGAHQPFALSAELTAALEQLSRREGVTLFTTLLAGFQVLLGRSAATEDVCVGTPVATRTEPGAETVVGCCMNTLVLRADLSGDPTFRALLQRVRTVTLDAFAHQDVPFERVVQALQPDRAGDAPLFQAMLVLHNARVPDLTVADLQISPVDVESGAAVTDLALLLDVGPRLRGTLEYRADRFDDATVGAMLERYRRLLEAAVADPDGRISALPLLTSEERHTVLVANNAGDDVADGGGCLHTGFEARADRTPQATALVSGDGRLTYDQVDRRANQLAQHLRGLGVGPEVVVGVCLERSPEAVVAALAVAKAGGAYLPLDPDHPAARLRRLLEDADPAVVLTRGDLRGRLPQHDVAVVALDEEGGAIARASQERPVGGAGPDDLAYVLFTSGSTGEPKGVLVEHRAISHQLAWRQHAFPLSDADAVLQRTPLTFDPSVWELFGPLAAGARLVLPPAGSDADPAALARVIAEQQVTTLQVVPSVLEALLDEPALGRCRSLRRVLCGGEPLRAELRDRFLATCAAELHNLYGPTEAAIDATSWDCRRDPDAPVVPIGHPVGHARIYVLDDHLEPVPIGVPGQLHIGGRGLARGYLGDLERTRERFIADPFDGTDDARMYRTGDRGRWRPDGSIELLGRVDDQVQLRGVRVEPGEIEAALVRHPAVRDAAVVARPAPTGEAQLVAFVAAEGAAEPASASLQRFLAEQLPGWMLPSMITVLDDGLPRTASGKLQRVRLVERADAEPSKNSVAPRDEVEQRLVEVWERFFPDASVGVTDDFFALGGHSLLAVRVLACVHRELGVDLPLSSLLQGRTIEQLARRLRAGPEPPTPLVAVQPHGSRRPLYCVHPVSGTGLCYAALARALGGDRPLYTLDAAGLRAGEDPHARIEDMAGHYLAAIREVQPTGPYLLGGWSMGGVIAYEMARQLEQQGERVDLLALLDARLAAGDGSDLTGDTADDAALLRGFVESLGLAPDDPDGLAPDDPDGLVTGFWERSPDEQLAWVLARARARGLVPPDLELPGLHRQLRVFTTNLRAMRSYEPGRYSGTLTLFEAAGSPSANGRGPRWDDLAAGVRRHAVAGDHHTMLREPAVAQLARRLAACLDEADPVLA
jgi:amino acid adenylation domain-containing protein